MQPAAICLEELLPRLEKARETGQRIVFTNGVFDLLHPGHVRYLRAARAEGDLLVVGLNSDESVRRNKGPLRPILAEDQRAKIIASLEMVDYVTLFSEDTPLNLIRRIRPHVLVKGGDYTPDQIVGRAEVERDGGKTLALPFHQGMSSTDIVDRILSSEHRK